MAEKRKRQRKLSGPRVTDGLPKPQMARPRGSSRIYKHPALAGLSSFMARRLVLVRERLDSAEARVDKAEEELQDALLLIPGLVNDRREKFEHRR